MDKVPTGIPGFDELVQGGFTPKSANLIAAGPGCGKTLFCLQFLWNGLTKFNDNCLFISFEENIDDLRLDARAMGWNFEEFERQGRMKFVYFHPYEVREVHRDLERQVQLVGAKRVVIDSTSVYGMTMETQFEVRKGLFELAIALKKLGCVSLLTTEVSDTERGSRLSRFGVEEILADSIVLITYDIIAGRIPRSIIIRKMRRTKNDHLMFPMEITDQGIVVHRESS